MERELVAIGIGEESAMVSEAGMETEIGESRKNFVRFCGCRLWLPAVAVPWLSQP
jgi:hypothetical protein